MAKKKPKPSPRPRLDAAIIKDATALAAKYTAEKGVPVDWQTAIRLALAEAANRNVPTGDAQPCE